MRVCCAHMHVCICGATLWSVFFLCRWFCPFVCVSGSVSFPCRDGLVMHEGGGKQSNKLLWFLFHSVPCCGLYFSISISLLSVNLPTSTLPSLSSSLLSAQSSSSLLVSFNLFGLCLSVSLSLFPCHSFTTSISSAGTPE